MGTEHTQQKGKKKNSHIDRGFTLPLYSVLLIHFLLLCFSSVQFSHSVVSDSLQPHGLQQACLSITNSWSLFKLMPIKLVMPSNYAILCRPLFLLPSVFPRKECQLFKSGSQSIGASLSASALPMNIQDWFPLGLTDFISLQSKGLSRVFSSTIGQNHQFFGTQLSLGSNSHIHTWLLEKH